jgi:hypothetical protein
MAFFYPEEPFVSDSLRPKKRANARRRINKANNQSMLVDHWPTLRPLSLPITTQIIAYTPFLPDSLHAFD